MPYTVNYRLRFNTIRMADASFDTAEEITCEIADTASPEGDAEYTDLDGSGAPVVIETVNNGRDPFAPILAKSCRIQFLSSGAINSETFSQGTDRRFFVHAYSAAGTIFAGFLLMDDIEERFRNPELRNVVTLTATDGIGTLKEQEFKPTFLGIALPDAHYPGVFFLQFALKQTGLDLPLNIVWNVFEEDFSVTDSPLNQLQIWSLTFEKEINVREDAYTVLQKMASSLKSRIFQYGGEWWFVRLHEYRTEATTLKRIKYDAGGNAITPIEDIEVSEAIASTADLYFVGGDANKVPVRADKYDKDTYRFEYPREIIRNINFTRGELIGGTNPKTFQIEGWTLERYGGDAPNVSAFIRRSYDSNNQEESRYVVITGGPNEHWIKSQPVPLHKNDKFNFSVSQKFSRNLTGNGGHFTFHVAMLRLHGDDGTFWSLNGNANFGPIEWAQSNAGFTANIRYVSRTWDITKEDESQDWWTVDVEAPPLPVDGELFVLLRKSDYRNDYDTYFANLQFDYIPHMVGTYAKYVSQWHKVEQAPEYKANHDDEVTISDTVKKLFKGATKKFNGVKWVLTEGWTDTFSGQGPVRLGRIMVYDVWNQYKDGRAVIRGTIRGAMPGYSALLHKFTLPGYSATKRFVFLSEEVNLKRLETTGELIEVFDADKPNDYTTEHAFNYEQ